MYLYFGAGFYENHSVTGVLCKLERFVYMVQHDIQISYDVSMKVKIRVEVRSGSTRSEMGVVSRIVNETERAELHVQRASLLKTNMRTDQERRLKITCRRCQLRGEYGLTIQKNARRFLSSPIFPRTGRLRGNAEDGGPRDFSSRPRQGSQTRVISGYFCV